MVHQNLSFVGRTSRTLKRTCIAFSSATYYFKDLGMSRLLRTLYQRRTLTTSSEATDKQRPLPSLPHLLDLAEFLPETMGLPTGVIVAIIGVVVAAPCTLILGWQSWRERTQTRNQGTSIPPNLAVTDIKRSQSTYATEVRWCCSSSHERTTSRTSKV